MAPVTDAGIAQLVEHDLAKVGVASSSLVSRSNLFAIFAVKQHCLGRVAEWSCSGLQIRVRRFDSDLGLHIEVSTCLHMLGYLQRKPA